MVRQLPGVAGRTCAIVRIARMAVQHLSCTDLRIAGELRRMTFVTRLARGVLDIVALHIWPSE